MTGLRSRLLLLALFCLAVAAPAHAEKRVALVIGNGFYQYQPVLTNPKHDAEDVAKALGDLNFDVVLGLDLTRADMNEKLDEFSRKADGADIAFVYYSGHGMQFGGFNYLLPKDASLDSAADVNPFRLVRIDSVMETLRGVNGPKIVVLDACRDNPVANELKRKLAALRGVKGAEVTRGLSPISASSVSGLLVAYATQADETALDGKGRNSPFTAAFIKNVADPDTDIRQMFFHVQDEVVRETDGKQRPEISVSLVGEYKLKITITPVNPGETVPAGPPTVSRVDVAQFCESVAKIQSLAVVQTLAETYKGTPMGACATARVEELKSQIAKAMPAPPPSVVPAPAPPPPKITEPQIAAAAPPVVPAVPPGPCGAAAATVSLSSRSAAPLSATEECSLKPKDTFKECANCPEMVVLPSGSFTMGSPANEPGRHSNEGPQHEVTIAQRFAISQFELTFDEWDACVNAGGCTGIRYDEGWGRGRRPVINVKWDQANAYLEWLAKKTGKAYRLLTEAEYEYATRAGTTTAYPWGNAIGLNNANCDGCGGGGEMKTAPVGSYAANGFGLYDMVGNVWEWTQDCYHASYVGAPSDGSAWTSGDCTSRVMRGGSWANHPDFLRSASARLWDGPNARQNDLGFRVARTLVTTSVGSLPSDERKNTQVAAVAPPVVPAAPIPPPKMMEPPIAVAVPPLAPAVTAKPTNVVPAPALPPSVVSAYPARPVKIMVGYGAGGAADITARLIGQWLSEQLGQPFFIEDRAGAGSNLGTEAVAHAQPDGYSLLLVSQANAVNASLYRSLSFDFVRDIAPVALIAKIPGVMVVNPSVPAKTVPELIEYAKANSGKLLVASTESDLAGQLFNSMTGIHLESVSYRGAGPALDDLMGGQIQVAFSPISSVLPFIKAGKLRTLGVTTAKRLSALPDIPALAEFVPGYEASGWYGIGAQSATPPELVAKLNKEINAALNDPTLQRRFADLATEAARPGPPSDLGQLITGEVEKWAKVIQFAGIQLK
jgi:formylglycine-generating enzyme required for sulfatase activity/tripartite-type tricarboxylate transporter receptor subunit TctC